MRNEIIDVAKRLIESVEFDVNGLHGKGGHGGLTSDKTLRTAGELRVIIDRAEREAGDTAPAQRLYEAFGQYEYFKPWLELDDQTRDRWRAALAAALFFDCESSATGTSGGEQ